MLIQPDTMPAIVEIRNLSKHYPATIAVDGIDLTIESGSCFGMLGPNGAGKTTTIEMMEGITTPTSGTILYKGAPPGERFRNECGIQFQHTALQEFLSVRETLQLFRGLYPKPAPLDELVAQCALGEFLQHDNRQLSGGQRQRLLLAIALVNRPALLFLDEPTTGLDPQARHNFWELIRQIRSSGTTVLLSTHYMEEAAELCDQIVIMDQGRIIAQGEPDALLRHHFSERLVRLPEADIAGELDSLGCRIKNRNGWVEILTTDVNMTLAGLLQRGADLSHLQVRQRNLEDLFLELTGSALRQ